MSGPMDCPACTYTNVFTATICKLCDCPLGDLLPVTWGSDLAAQHDERAACSDAAIAGVLEAASAQWRCSECTMLNSRQMTYCEACGAPYPSTLSQLPSSLLVLISLHCPLAFGWCAIPSCRHVALALESPNWPLEFRMAACKITSHNPSQ